MGTMYIAHNAHIKRSFGRRGEAGKYGIWSFRLQLSEGTHRQDVNINKNVCQKPHLAHAHLGLRLENR